MKNKRTIKTPPQHGEIIIFTTEDKQSHLEVKLEQDTVWLTQKQIAELFKTERSVITKHLNNIFKNKELDETSVCAIFAHSSFCPICSMNINGCKYD